MHLRCHVVRHRARRLRDGRLRRRVMGHWSLPEHGRHVLGVGLGGDDDGRARLVGRLLWLLLRRRRRRMRHVLMLVRTRLPPRLKVMSRRTRMRIVLRRIGVWMVHGRLRRRVVVCVRVVFLLSTRLRIHGRTLVHMRLTGPSGHVMVHHVCRRRSSDGRGREDQLSRLREREGRRWAFVTRRPPALIASSRSGGEGTECDSFYERISRGGSAQEL